MNTKVSYKNILELLIQLYVVLIMISASTGAYAVKAIRIVLIVFLVLYVLKKKSFFTNWYEKWGTAFMLLNVGLIDYSFDKIVAQKYAMSLLYVLAVNIFLYKYVKENNYYEKIFKSIIIGSLLKSIIVFSKYGFLAFLSSRGNDEGSANLIGLYCAMACTFCIYFISSSKKNNKMKMTYILLFVLNVIFLVLSASRKAVLFFSIPVGCYYLFHSKNIMKSFKNIVVVLIFVFLAYYFLMNVQPLYDLLGNRIESMISGFVGNETDSSTSTRLYLINDGLTWFNSKPIFGYGPGNYRALHSYKYTGKYLYAHNNYIELLVDFGIVGIVIYYSLYIRILRYSLTKFKKDNLSLILFGIFLSIVVCEYGFVSYYDSFVQLLLVLILCNFDSSFKNKNKNKVLRNI